MKEIVAISTNHFAILDHDSKPTPQVELIIMVTEPVYSLDQVGQVVKARNLDSFRVAASPFTLRKVAKLLESAAKESEELLAKELDPKKHAPTQ